MSTLPQISQMWKRFGVKILLKTVKKLLRLRNPSKSFKKIQEFSGENDGNGLKSGEKLSEKSKKFPEKNVGVPRFFEKLRLGVKKV